MPTRLTVIVAVIVALFASTALTSPASADGSYYSMAARAYWGGNPGCGDPGIDHWVWGNLSGYADYGSCHIWVNAAAFGSWPAGRACMIVLHEWGHLRGAGDSWDPYSVMYYAMNPWANIPYVRWPCSW